MIVNVPVQAVVAQAVLPMAAVVEAVPQAAVNVPVQAVVAQAVVPMAAVVEAVPQAAVVQAAVAPQSIMMSRGQMDGRVEEIQSGCYTLSDCLCCYWAYYKVDARAGTVTYGPCCCIFMGCCPVVIPDEIKIAVAPGASDFRHRNGGEDVYWETPTRMRKYHPQYDPPRGTAMHKCC